jgi:nucleoside 2-deoxyribosyltransferase
MYKVYLAGPITGLSYEGCTSWREYAKAQLDEAYLVGLDPMRQKDYLLREKIVGDAYDTVLSCSRGIMTRDHWDCTRCDVILVNLIGATKVSIGTVMEIAWAWDNDIPVVLCIEKEGNIHDHAMIREATGFRVNSLEEGLTVVKAILST